MTLLQVSSNYVRQRPDPFPLFHYTYLISEPDTYDFIFPSLFQRPPPAPKLGDGAACPNPSAGIAFPTAVR